jgi:putative variant cofactor biosynthesis B12-binding/radical SAM domain protein 1
MRVLLVQAFTALDMELVYPLGLAYLASHLDGHEVTVFDLNLHREAPYRALAREVARTRPEVIGFSLRNMKVGRPDLHTDDFGPQQEAIRTAKQVAPDAVIVLGGTAFGLYAEAMMARLPEADMGVWGEAEHRFPALLSDLDHPERVRGVYYRRDGRVHYTGAPSGEDWSRLRHPRRDLLPMAPYAASSAVSIGVQAKRGCGLNCIHCSDTFLSGKRVRLRDPGDVVDEIAALVRDHGVRQFFFCDQIFNIPVSHAIAICEEILRRGLDVRWSAWFNEHHNTLPDALLVLLKRAGCGLLSFSPDHVDDRMLRALDKNFTHADMLHTVQVAKRHGMDVEYSFFLNAPGEDLRSLTAILRFLVHARVELGPRLRLFSLLMMQPIRIYPHTRLQTLAVERGLLAADHPLLEGQFWNPGALRWAVAGIQAGAGGVYRARRAWREARGQPVEDPRT